MKCINCKSSLIYKIIEFKKIPLSNNFTKNSDAAEVSKYPLGLIFCKKCKLVQNSKIIKNEIRNRKLIIKIDTQSFDELIVSHIPLDVIKRTVLLNYELTSVDGIKKQRVSVNAFKKRVLNFNTIWSKEIKNISTNWLIDELNNSLNQKNIETDIYLLK